jgi:hypothetical protein
MTIETGERLPPPDRCIETPGVFRFIQGPVLAQLEFVGGVTFRF